VSSTASASSFPTGLGDLPGACRKAGIQPLAPHDLRRTWTSDLLDAGVDLATVQKTAGHASVSTTGRYDRRDHAVQLKAAGQLQVPYVLPEN
jgi:integrase/recombinase XerD